MGALPGFSDGLDGTSTYDRLPSNRNAEPAKPGTPSVTSCSVPVCPPTASAADDPDFSSRCHSATGVDAAPAADDPTPYTTTATATMSSFHIANPPCLPS